MAAIQSNMLELGTKAPNLELLNVLQKKTNSLDELKSENATVIMFICNHCPFVKHIGSGLSQLGKDYLKKEVSIIAISSNDIINYPQDSPEKMVKFLEEYDINFTYLYDETQEVAKAYKAACTPDFYVFDKNMELAYRGQFDDSRPSNDLPVTGKDIRNAIDTLLTGGIVNEHQIPSIGCNIKWK
jgi:peroxiredoxin